MSNAIQIKRGSGKPDGKLAPYELGIDVSDGQLYYGGSINNNEYGGAQGIKVAQAEKAIKIVDKNGNGQNVGTATGPIYLSNGEFRACGDGTTIPGTTEYAKALNPGATIVTNLADSNPAMFTGAENSQTIIGATGILPPAKGGTGIKEEISFQNLILNMCYPVGSIYTSTVNKSPAEFLGGTWEQIQGQFLLAAGTTPGTENTYTAGSSGGSKSHTHGLANGYAEIIQSSTGYILNNFKHGISWWYGGQDISRYSDQTVLTSVNSDKAKNPINTATRLGGTTESGSNLPPYLVVYMWRRTD